MNRIDPTPNTNGFATAIEIIAKAAVGRMFILVADEDRENDGDLIILADMADANAINFMAILGRGLICLALEGEIVDRLGTKMMSQTKVSRLETAFTVSIEAREGVTTGISAKDRAVTVAAAIRSGTTKQDVCSPGPRVSSACPRG